MRPHLQQLAQALVHHLAGGDGGLQVASVAHLRDSACEQG